MQQFGPRSPIAALVVALDGELLAMLSIYLIYLIFAEIDKIVKIGQGPGPGPWSGLGVCVAVGKIDKIDNFRNHVLISGEIKRSGGRVRLQLRSPASRVAL